MENAAKALIIAGGILIALIIIAIGIYSYNSITSLETQTGETKRIEQIAKFNEEYESFSSGILRGNEIITIVNKALSYNEKHEEKIKISVMFEKNIDDTLLKTENKTYIFTNDDDGLIYNNIVNNHKKAFIESNFFKCVKIEYNNIDGKVSAMYFEQILITV